MHGCRHLLAGALTLAGASCADDFVDRGSAPVIGGTLTPAGLYEATGALVASSPEGGGPMVFCTGTLIAPDLVLTAGHCVDTLFLGDQVPGFTLALDANVAQPGDIYAGASMAQHPSFDLLSEPPERLGQWFDLGVVVLADPVLGVPHEVLPSPDDAARLAADGEIEIVGYGLTVGGGEELGVKMNAATSLVEVGDWELYIGNPGQPQNCQGDSGGPALAHVGPGGERRIVGIVSRGTEAGAQTCDMGGIDTRVDAYLEWIHAQGTIPCGSGLSEPCTPPEPDAGPPGEPDAGGPSDTDGGPGVDGGDGDCGCAVAPRLAPTSSLWLGLGFGCLALLARRRRR